MSDDKTKGFVSKNGPFGYSPVDDSLENIEIFEGSENNILINRIYNMKFLCEYKLQMYPFDSQICFAQMDVDSAQTLFVDLVLGSFVYQGPADLQNYFVKSATMSQKDIRDEVTLIEIEMSLGRGLMNSILTIYLPTILLICIIHSTNYFKGMLFKHYII